MVAQVVGWAILQEGGIEPTALSRVPHDLSMYRQVVVGMEIEVRYQGEYGESRDVDYGDKDQRGPRGSPWRNSGLAAVYPSLDSVAPFVGQGSRCQTGEHRSNEL